MESFTEYQRRAYALALPTTKNPSYMVLGIANEAGEVAGKLKKHIRGDKSLVETKEEMLKELGDVLWYLAGAATVFQLTLAEIASYNIGKLEDRQARGKLQGDGDNR
jgi:NTP pyrophosphatase (non-canonical NTP hydrolase)